MVRLYSDFEGLGRREINEIPETNAQCLENFLSRRGG